MNKDIDITNSIRKKVIKSMSDKELKHYSRFAFYYFGRKSKQIRPLLKAEIRQRKLLNNKQKNV